MQKSKQFEYSSLIIGSKHIPVNALVVRRSSNIINAKTFLKKGQSSNPKNNLMKKQRIRTKNQRPDIFLEGEQVMQSNNVFIAFKNQFPSELFKQKYNNYHFTHQIPKRTQYLSLNSFKQKIPICDRKKRHPQQSLDKNESEIKFYQNEIYSHKNSEQSQKVRQSSVNVNRYYDNKIINVQSNVSSCSQRFDPQRQHRRSKIIQKIKYKHQADHQKTTLEGRKDKIELKREINLQKKPMFYLNQKDLIGIRAESFLVMEYPSSQIITGLYYRKSLEIASLTKIMTFYATIKAFSNKQINIDQEFITIEDHITNISGTSAELYPGDVYSIRQLLYGMMLPSGNDAALALAEWTGNLIKKEKDQNSRKAFVAYMNQLAVQIGLRSTTFGNPHGLPHPQNASTAQDVSLLICKCLEYPLFCEVIGKRQYKCQIEFENGKREVIWQNSNKLLRRNGFVGIKTGITATAGSCLATLYKAGNRSFIVVLLKTNKLSRRFKETRFILSMVLKKINQNAFAMEIKQLQTNDIEFDSDNSEEEEEFNFDRNDPWEFDRRIKILQNQL